MKRLLIIPALFFYTIIFAQRVSKIALSETGNVDAIVISLNESVVLNLGTDGTITKWGVDIYEGIRENYMNKLQEYTGKTVYYSENDDSAYKGKIRYIGMTPFTYFASYEKNAGKLKSIGNNRFEYFTEYEDEMLRGKIKSIGNVTFNFYSSYDNEASRGKIKSVGNSFITYYGAVEDKAFAGKIKSIDRNNYIYYSSSENINYRGRLKSGSQIAVINGIKFQIKNF